LEKETGNLAARALKCRPLFFALIIMSNSLYALILAGGSGERFWPLSRRVS
jgi:hypothetical protein